MNDEIKATLRVLAQQVARAKEMVPPAPAAAESKHRNTDREWRFICGITESPAQRKALIVFAGWLWNTGTQDQELVLHIIEDRLRTNPANPYAYYAPEGKARNVAEGAWAMEFARRENAAFKQADLDFFGSGE